MDGCEKKLFMKGYGIDFVGDKVADQVICTPAGAGAWKTICSGGTGFFLAVSDSGALFAFGEANEYGQSGPQVQHARGQPREIRLPGVTTIVHAAAGPTYSLAVAGDGEVFQWGFLPRRDQVDPVTSPVIGGATSVADQEKEIGRFVESPKGPGNVPVFQLLFGPRVSVASVAAGDEHCLALSDVLRYAILPSACCHKGCLIMGWGQLGLGESRSHVAVPQEVPCSFQLANGGSKTLKVVCGSLHSAVLSADGGLQTFGWGLYGQCGHGTTDDQRTPRRVAGLGGVNVADVAAGRWHTVCCSVDGGVYAWGGNQGGQLGDGGTTCQVAPCLVEGALMDAEVAVQVACGTRHTVVRTGRGGRGRWTRMEKE